MKKIEQKARRRRQRHAFINVKLSSGAIEIKASKTGKCCHVMRWNADYQATV